MSTDPILLADAPQATPLTVVFEADFSAWFAAQDSATQAQLTAQRFEGKRYTQALCFDAAGKVVRAVVGARAQEDIWTLGNAALSLPPQAYALDPELPAGTRLRLALGFALGAYQFLRYRPRAARAPAQLLVQNDDARIELERIAAAAHGARDLVNTPTEDLGPEQMQQYIAELASRHPVVRNNPRTVNSAADVLEILELAWN